MVLSTNSQLLIAQYECVSHRSQFGNFEGDMLSVSILILGLEPWMLMGCITRMGKKTF
jgi:hypothetical protein